MEVSGSLQLECNKRLEQLFINHNIWLLQVAFNISKDKTLSEDLVGELYQYLGEKCNKQIFWGNSYNLQYCRSFINSRFINQIKRGKKILSKENFVEESWDIQDTEYDFERDEKIDKAIDEVKENLEIMKRTKGWSSAMIYEHYWFSNKTLDEVSKDIGISKSTTFLAVKKTKDKLRNNIQNPFDNE